MKRNILLVLKKRIIPAAQTIGVLVLMLDLTIIPLLIPFSAVRAQEATPSASSISPTPINEPEIPTVDWADQGASSTSSEQVQNEIPQVTPTPTPTISPTVLPTTPTLTPTPQLEEIKPTLSQTDPVSSAKIRRRARFKALIKRTFRASESVNIDIEDGQGEDKTIKVLDPAGKEADIGIYKEINESILTLHIVPHASLKPGKYQVQLTDESGTITQDFTWGVLAINPDKSIYLKGEQSKIFMAVLDEKGEMACDAKVHLTITSPDGSVTEKKTDDGSIAVTGSCGLKEFAVESDYETTYQTGELGKYNLTFSAITKNGTYEVTDGFEVRESILFDIQRDTATRIYPVKNYPVKFTITANTDFKGTIVETVPEHFAVMPLKDYTPYDTMTVETMKSALDATFVTIQQPFKGTYRKTLGFGEEPDDRYLKQQYSQFGLSGHDGVDYALPEGTTVLAADSGTVILAGPGAYGTTVVIEHEWGRSYYGHLSKTLVQLQQKVSKGDEIALSGHTGLATGSHLHFGIKRTKHNLSDGYYGKSDPTPYINNQTFMSDYSVKKLTWNINVKKGEKITIGYQYDPPNTSPEFYLLGPLTFQDGKKDVSSTTTPPEINPFVLGIGSSSAASTPIAIEATASANQAVSSATNSVVLNTNPLVTAEASSSATPSASLITHNLQPTAHKAIFQEVRQWQIAADAPDVTLEQQINIIDQTYSTTSTSADPSNGSLGYFYWDAAKYSGIASQSAQLEIDAVTSATTAQIIGALYDDSGNILQRSKATVGNANKIVTVDGCAECDTYSDTLYTYTVLDSQGFPVISYIDNTNGDLKLVHCGDVNCTSNNIITIVDGCATCNSSGVMEKHQGLALDSYGNPMIAYRDGTAGDLLFVHCGNVNCSSGNTYQTLDGCASSPCVNNEDLGSYASMILDSIGYPVITYFSEAVDDLMFLHCGDANCSSNTYVRLDGCIGCTAGLGVGQTDTGSTGQYNSIRLNSTTGFPVISYRDGATLKHDLKLVKCGDANCAVTSATYTVVDDGVDSNDSAGLYTDLKLDSSNNPVIVFARGKFATGNMRLKFVHCGSTDCSTGNTMVTLDGMDNSTNCANSGGGFCEAGDVGWYNKLQLDSSANHNPIISYRANAAVGQLKVIHCNDANCSGNDETVSRVDGCTGCDEPNGSGQTNGSGGYTSLQLDGSGFPVIAFRKVGPNTGQNDLKLVHCGNADCNPTGSGQTDPTNYQTARSAWFTPSTTAGVTTRNLTLRVWVTGGTGTVKAARLKIVQTDSTKITDTQSQVELGNDQTITSTTYGELTDPKYYYYDTAKFSGTKSAFFEATLKGDGGQGNGRIWSSGFESNSTTANMELTTCAGTNSVQSTTKRSGTYALQINLPTAATGTCNHTWAGTAADDNVYVRFYLYYNSSPSGLPSALANILEIHTATAVRASIRMNSNGTLELWNATAQVGSDSSALTADAWNRIELHYDSTPAVAGTDVLDARIEGTSFASSTAQSLGTVGRFRWGINTSVTANVFFDDIALNNSTGSWPGPGHIIHLKPNAVGDNAGWTIGGSAAAATNWQGVNEVPPDDGTTLNSSNTVDQIDDHYIEDSTLAANDEINVVQVGVRFNGVGTSANASFVLRVKDSIGGTAEENVTPITPSNATWKTNTDTAAVQNYALTLYDLPGASTTKWTDGTLDTAQIGYRLSSASTNVAQISNVWMLVDYTLNSELSGVSAQAKLQQCDEASCTWTDVTGSSISSLASTYQKVRSSDISANLTSGRRYRAVVAKSTASGTTRIANAKLIIGQTDTAGITSTEMVHQYVNTLVTDTDSTYTDQNYLNQFVPGNYSGGTFTYYFDATFKTSAGTGYAQLWNDSDGTAISSSEVPTDSTSYVRVRSAAITPPTTTKNLDTQVKNLATDTTSVGSTTLIIDVTSLQTSVTATTPTLDQLMRHGNWFTTAGVEQSFTF